ncbi:hypothetical protein DFH07DRAFT_968062 [Mycena maculata]|uniref:Uncharacterized protein n=1 Tax=Mycena maculata TaxID=230809 RepID=A0AAD7I3R7_9AGAR|nr:hypothetical protein DFH07DRAFT_968062 [Mycena maculata]
MTNNPRTQPPQMPVGTVLPIGLVVLGFPLLAAPVFQTTGCHCLAPAATATAPAASTPAPVATAPAPAVTPTPTATSAETTIPTRAPAGAGLPAPLVALLRTEGPYLANEVYSVIPAEPLGPIEEADAAPEWYAITRGRFVGVVDQFALSAVAISGVAHAARKAYTTQRLALDAFNQALTWGGVQVV